MKRLFSGLVPALLLALVFALGGCGSDLNVTEDDVIKRTREEIALMAPMMECQVGKIKADLDKRAVILEDVVMIMAAMPDLEFRVAKITTSGTDVPSYEGKPGDRTEIESVVYQNIKIFMNDEKVADLAEYLVEGMNLAYRDLLQTMRDSQELDTEEFTRKIAPYMASYTAKKIAANGLKIAQGKMTASIESLESLDVALGTYGPAVVNRFTLSERGNEVFAIEKFGYSAMRLPQAFQDMALNPNPDQAFQLMFMMMEDPLKNLSPLDVKDFYLENLKVTPEDHPVTLAKIAGDLAIQEGNFILTSELKGLALGQELMKSTRSLRIIGEAAGGQDLVFDGIYNMNMITSAAGERKTTIRSALADKKQGDASLDLSFSESKDPNYGYYDAPLLHSLDLNVNDSGLVDVLLAFYASTEFGYYVEDYKSIRGEFLTGLSYLNEELPPLMQEGLGKFTQLIQNGGKFRFAMNPKAPVDLDDVEDILLENPDILGCSFDYSAPATPKNR